jgi:hypothetical protein
MKMLLCWSRQPGEKNSSTLEAGSVNLCETVQLFLIMFENITE